MDFALLLLQLVGLVIWAFIMAPPVLLLVSAHIYIYLFSFNARWLNMTTVYLMRGTGQWKKSILIGDALYAALLLCPHNIWSFSTFLALKVYIMILMAPLGLNVTNATPPSIYSVGHGSQKLLLRPSTSSVHFTAVNSFECVGSLSR